MESEERIGQGMHGRAAKSAFWMSTAFYGLIAFEFFYMFSPFAAYLYSVYGPGLHALNLSDSTSWLIAFFMPHIVHDKTSWLITWHEPIGGVLFAGGLLAFLAGVYQIYRNKLLNRGAVSSGIYRRIRHPQYLALMISGFGMVLLWPRYLVLFGFVTVCFAYYLLAKVEERNCLRLFPDYQAYMDSTGVFLPAGFGNGLGRIDPMELEMMIADVKMDPDAIAFFADHAHPDLRFINYVISADLLISEVPMFMPDKIKARSPEKTGFIIVPRTGFEPVLPP